MDARQLARAVIVGHSLGANNAMRFAAEYPERTAALVLIGAIALPGASPDVQALKKAVATLRDPIDRQFAHEFQMSTIARPVDPALVEMFVDESVKVPARVWRSALDGLFEADIPATMGRVKTRVLLIWGTRDTVTSRRDQDALLAANPRAALKVYEGIGHAVHWETPARVAADIAAFVSAVVDRATTSSMPGAGPPR
jgi:pimeloyl-ACP methyl ester carboxylesterase